MSTATPEVEEVAQPRGGKQGLWRRHRGTLLITAALVAAVTLAAVTGGGPGTTEPLDPDNANPDGARALAQVLGDEGVDVEVVRDAESFEQADTRGGATIVITSTRFLSPELLRRVRTDSAASRVVLVGPEQGVLNSLQLPVDRVSPGGGDEFPAECDDHRVDDLTLEVDLVTPYDADGCFPTGDGALLVESRTVTLVGAAEALTNDQILRGDNAAFALRLLGQDDRLIWYVPSVDDIEADEGVAITSLLPRWVMPGLFLLGLVMVALALWRARRLGPLATEPLPVTVKAIETTLSRGRLYRKAGDRAHAASRLRAATRARLAARLHAGAHPDEPTLLRDLAAHLGRRESELAQLLGSDAPTPAFDNDLIHLANALTALEEEVRSR